VLQHIRCEPPGLFSGLLRDRGFVTEVVEVYEGGGLPDWREAGLVLAMGGPMGPLLACSTPGSILWPADDVL
jgi:hypothetical protein